LYQPTANMPNRTGRNKKIGSQIRGRVARERSRPRSVAELLAAPGSAARPPGGSQAPEWTDVIRGQLPAALGLHVSRAEYVKGALVLFTESAAWSARLRFALAEAGEAIRRLQPQVRKIVIRIAPGAGRRR
jgi:hypothetical protein